MILSNLGIFGDKKGRNLNIFLKYGVSVCGRVLLWWWCFMVSTGPEVCRLSMLQDLPEVGSGPLVVRSHAFCPLYCIVLVVSLANMALFRVLKAFLEGFGV